MKSKWNWIELNGVNFYIMVETKVLSGILSRILIDQLLCLRGYCGAGNIPFNHYAESVISSELRLHHGHWGSPCKQCTTHHQWTGIPESAHNSHYVSLYFHEVLPKHRCTLTFHHLSSLMPHMCECSVYVHSTSNSLLVVRCLQKALLMPVFGQTLSFVCCTHVTCVLVVLVLCVLTCAWHLCSL